MVEVFNHCVENSFAAYLYSPVPAQFFGTLMEMSRDFPALAVCATNWEVAGFACHSGPSFNRTAKITYFIGTKHAKRAPFRSCRVRSLAKRKSKSAFGLNADI